MANPPVLVCDADALFQLLLANQTTPLRILRDQYGMQPIILPEVEVEIKSHSRLAGRVAPHFKKACDRGLIRTVDSAIKLAELFQGNLNGAALWSAIQKRGADYRKQTDLGEAYTHAAAVEMQAPALSHDINAIRALRYKDWPVAEPTLRAYDLLVLCWQINELNDQACESFRQTMIREGEWVSGSFRNSSFRKGLDQFAPRILDGDANPAGSHNCSAEGCEKQITIRKL